MLSQLYCESVKLVKITKILLPYLMYEYYNTENYKTAALFVVKLLDPIRSLCKNAKVAL